MAYAVGIGLCIQGAVWSLGPYLINTRLVALVATVLLGIGIIMNHRRAPTRILMVGLHMELQAAFLGFTLGHQLFDVYPGLPIWSGAIGNVTTGVVLAIVLGSLGTVALRFGRWLRHLGCTASDEQRSGVGRVGSS